ncbi:MAG: hypothetical protein WB992_21065, partial [Bryobacteraceae bacterium]
VYVVLLIQARGPRTTALFVASNGQVDQEPSVREFQFDEAEFMSLPEIPSDSETDEQPDPKPSRAGNRWLKPLVIPLLIAVGALVLLWLISRTATYSHLLGPTSKALELTATEKDHLVQISWNHGARELNRAVDATLVIADGQTRQEIKLGQDELKLGVLEYQPNTGQIKVTMALKGQDGKPSEETVEWRQK